MKKLIFFISFLFIFFSNHGCTHRHVVVVNPTVFVKTSNIGSGKTIVLKVVDSRPNKDIYKKEANFKTNKVSIVADSNLEEKIVRSLKRGLQDMGFRVKTRPENGAMSLKVAILETKFSMFGDTSGFHQKMKAAFKATASKESKKYSKVYQDTQAVTQKVPFGRFLNEFIF